MRVAHERGDLGRAVALVQMDAARVHDHGDVVHGAHERLEGVSLDGRGVAREALDVVVIDAADGLDQALEVAEARSEHDGDGMLDGRLDVLHGVFGDHADPLLGEQAGAHAHACR